MELKYKNLASVFRGMKDPTGFPVTDLNLRGTMTLSTRTLSLVPYAGYDYFSFFHSGKEFHKTSASIEITNVTGIHIVYFDANGDIQEAVNPSFGESGQLIRGFTLVTIIYWNATDGEAIYFGEERHLNQMDGSNHFYLHTRFGLAYLQGLALTGFNVDDAGDAEDCQFAVGSGRVADEDIDVAISAIASTVGLPIYHQDINGWHRTVKAGYSARTVDNTSATNIAYNQYTGGAWQLTAVDNAKFCLYHIFATTEKDKPIISIMGQNQYETITDARTGAKTEVQSLILDQVLFPEIRPIGTIIYQASSTYTSDINARIRSTGDGDYVDWRSEEVSRVVLTTSNHNSLSGIQGGAVNDYYHLTAREIDWLKYATIKL